MHRGLLYKLQTKTGITDHLLLWLTDYISDRKQRVVLSGVISETVCISAGVPQGSILGPLLFLVYINDIVSDIDSSVRLFADDTSLYIVVDNPNVAASCLNSDHDKISKWAEKWLVTFSPDKTNK